MKALIVGLGFLMAFNSFAGDATALTASALVHADEFTLPLTRKVCSQAMVAKEQIAAVMAILNRNNVDFKVVGAKESQFGVVAISSREKKIEALENNKLLETLGTKFARSTTGSCFTYQRISEDISR